VRDAFEHAGAGRRRDEPRGQGVGARSWVNREGLMVVNDMNLAGVSLVSLCPRPAREAGWPIGVFR